MTYSSHRQQVPRHGLQQTNCTTWWRQTWDLQVSTEPAGEQLCSDKARCQPAPRCQLGCLQALWDMPQPPLYPQTLACRVVHVLLLSWDLRNDVSCRATCAWNDIIGIWKATSPRPLWVLHKVSASLWLNGFWAPSQKHWGNQGMLQKQEGILCGPKKQCFNLFVLQIKESIPIHTRQAEQHSTEQCLLELVYVSFPSKKNWQNIKQDTVSPVFSI